MEQTKVSARSIAANIIAMYCSLAGETDLDYRPETPNLVHARLLLLSAIVDGTITPDTFSFDEARGFHEAVLDAIALQYASGGQRTVFAPPEIGNSSLVGRKADRLSKLEGDEDAQQDWHFQLLVQAQASAEGTRPLRDLRDDTRFTGQDVCDFEIQHEDGSVELLECKRVHLHRLMPIPADHISAVVSKISQRLPKAAKQLNQTARVIGDKVVCRHLLIDVSAYCEKRRDVPYQFARIEVAGFSKDEADQVLSTISTYIDAGNYAIDIVTLCWQSLVLIDNKIRAIVQDTATSQGQMPDRSSFNYKGWTVEGYPMPTGEYREFRVSDSVRSLNWIVACYINVTKPELFYTIGPQMESGKE